VSASTTAPGDALQLPLDGIRAVEASAGTGKTFTIATLYLRLILERGLKVDEIVVATFTRAAAAELSSRLRQRLVIADTLLGEDHPGTPCAGEDGEHLETRKVVARAVANGAALDDLRARAREARLAIDTAFIGTLHGFCHRVLAEFGFETGQALAQPELLEDIRDLEGEIVRDFWRRGSADVATAALLSQTWGSPEVLAKQVCDPRWRGRSVALPEPDVATTESRFEATVARICTWTRDDLAEFERELQRCVKDTRARNNRWTALQGLRGWASGARGETTFEALDRKATASLSAANIEALKPEGVCPQGRVVDDLETLLSAFTACSEAHAVVQQMPAARLLRGARAWLENELPQRLAARNLMGHDQAVDRLADALADAVRGPNAAERIRARWKAALVDEFQDTDPRQWRVVETLFGPTTLVLVGDPKQAIYGFRGGDVFAWLQARAQARGEALRLAESWRAGTGFCTAVNALFSLPDAFIDAGIEHPDIHPAAAVAQRALLRDGEPLPALELWWLDPERVGHAQRSAVPSKAHAFRAIQQACVAWISRMLHDDGIRLRDKHGALHTLQPGHIAVLVNSNAQAHSMQAALGRAGVPASCNLRASVYASDEAADLALLLDALATPDDPPRARAARASLLAGDDAAAIAAGIDGDVRQAAVLEGVAAWRAAVQQHGPMAWLHGLVANAAPRLLALPDGERRVANYLQLAELLQDLDATSFGIADLATRFARARVEARDDADAARLRLDTDADAVTISTVHAAKGLEYEVVLVPYAVLGRDPGKQDKRPPLHWYHDDANAAHVAIGAGADRDITRHACDEIRAEDVRKFYVAVTRACALCVLPWGPVNQMQYSAAYHLLHSAGREVPLEFDAAGCDAALLALCERAEDAARKVDLPLPAPQPRRTAHATDGTRELRARTFTRTGLQRDWQVWSFSRLVRGSANHAAADPRPGAGDASSSDDDARETGPGGAAFGSAVHTVFEQTDYAAWRDAGDIPEGARALIEHALADHGVAGSDGATRRAIELTGQCVHDALNAALPCGVRLCDVAPDQRKAEIEFHLSLAPARAPAVYALLHAHGYQRQRGGVAAERLHGLLTGKIDLTFQHAGRFHIVDWKTNRCPPYDDATLRAEIAVHDYDLQWLIYTLALHRWLRQQLPDYDYDRHVGAVYYLFVRGMGEGQGVHVDRPPRALIEALDAMFDARTEVSA
jgi:exodeoxyribonuclease V beta subunit